MFADYLLQPHQTSWINELGRISAAHNLTPTLTRHP